MPHSHVIKIHTFRYSVIFQKTSAKNEFDPPRRLATVYGCPGQTDYQMMTIASSYYRQPKSVAMDAGESVISFSSRAILSWRVLGN